MDEDELREVIFDLHDGINMAYRFIQLNMEEPKNRTISELLLYKMLRAEEVNRDKPKPKKK